MINKYVVIVQAGLQDTARAVHALLYGQAQKRAESLHDQIPFSNFLLN